MRAGLAPSNYPSGVQVFGFCKVRLGSDLVLKLVLKCMSCFLEPSSGCISHLMYMFLQLEV